uniref:Uncharacterized protein n=1 Tax=viral metagenome TaxID=1070528 RepID=A0A6C0K9T4_9ZZZZ
MNTGTTAETKGKRCLRHSSSRAAAEAVRAEAARAEAARKKALDDRYRAMVEAMLAEQRANAHKPSCAYRHCVQKVETEGEFCGDLCKATAEEYNRVMNMTSEEYEQYHEERDAEFERQREAQYDRQMAERTEEVAVCGGAGGPRPIPKAFTTHRGYETEEEEPDDYDY